MCVTSISASKMRDNVDLESLPLSRLPSKTLELLSCLLDTQKIIPNGPDKLPRDWRGLADLVNISSEKAAYIRLCPHKTKEVLEIWKQDSNATVGQLLKHLERLDRYDVYDDLCDDLRESIRTRELVVTRQNQIAINNNNNNKNNNMIINQQSVLSAITYDDRPGYVQQYDAFVLYAQEDKPFVDALHVRMEAEGFQLCTVDKLQAGHATPYEPVAQLISERCQRIILICSPEFFDSQANTFYRLYAQAVTIESTNHRIIPIIYRQCDVPRTLKYYFKLYYNENEERSMYDFWQKLKQVLELARAQRELIANGMNGTTTNVQPQVKIVELPSSHLVHDYATDSFFPPTNHKAIESSGLDSLKVDTLTADSNSLSSVSQKSVSSNGKKKPKMIERIKKKLGIKSKKAIMVA